MIKIFLVLNFIFLSLCFAETTKTYLDQKCRCTESVDDPLEQPSAFNFGKFKGQCIDSCRFRPVKWLDPKNLKTRNIGNVLHLGQYYTTTITPESIESLSVGFEQFAPGISHTTLRFQFRKSFDAHLIPQNKNEKLLPAKKINSLIFSFEGVPAKDVSYSLKESLLGNYLIVPRVLTGDDYQAWTAKLKNPLHYFSVPYTQEQIQVAFTQALEKSEALGKNEVYQLFTNNCATKTISILLKAQSNTEFQTLSWINQTSAALPIVGPISTFSFLKEKNLIPNPEN